VIGVTTFIITAYSSNHVFEVLLRVFVLLRMVKVWGRTWSKFGVARETITGVGQNPVARGQNPVVYGQNPVARGQNPVARVRPRSKLGVAAIRTPHSAPASQHTVQHHSVAPVYHSVVPVYHSVVPVYHSVVPV
jgi:hypothetical protein